MRVHYDVDGNGFSSYWIDAVEALVIECGVLTVKQSRFPFVTLLATFDNEAWQVIDMKGDLVKVKHFKITEGQ